MDRGRYTASLVSCYFQFFFFFFFKDGTAQSLVAYKKDNLEDWHKHLWYLYKIFGVSLLFCGFTLQRTQTQNSMPNADLPQPFTDVTRAVLVDWLIQVHVSVTAGGGFLLPQNKAVLAIQIIEGHMFFRLAKE